MESFFVNKSNALPAAGIHAVTIHALGVPLTVIVDDFVPESKNEPGKSAFTTRSKDNAVWSMIYEKAMAKWMGNFAHINGNDLAFGIHSITGGG